MELYMVPYIFFDVASSPIETFSATRSYTLTFKCDFHLHTLLALSFNIQIVVLSISELNLF